MVTITIPLIPTFLAIMSIFLFLTESIDKEDRILTWVIIVPLSAFVFFAAYGAFTMLGMI